MVLKKQTIWLLTMLTLMVVLSAYYLYNPGETQPVGLDENKEDNNWLETIGEIDMDLTSFSGMEQGGFFHAYRLEREVLQAKQLDEFQKIVSSDTSAEAIAQAQNNIERIYDLAEAEMTLESLIEAEGYEEAVVIADADKVNVIVKSEDALEKKQVIDIIHLVSNHLNMSGNQVTVNFRN